VLASTVEQRKMVLSQQMKLIVHNMCHITIGLGSFRFPDERRMISPSSLFIHIGQRIQFYSHAYSDIS
jgi:hypothetical protein